MVVLKLKEKIKKFWNEFKEHWLWISIGNYMGINITLWILYFYGFAILGMTLTFSLVAPLILLGIYYLRKSKYQTDIYKYVWIIGGAASIGGLIWFGIAYILQGAPWAPFRDYPLIFRIPFDIITTVLCWALGGYIGYRLGKKRDFRPFI